MVRTELTVLFLIISSGRNSSVCLNVIIYKNTIVHTKLYYFILFIRNQDELYEIFKLLYSI